MTYVLVHLVGDDATRAATRLVKHLEAERPASTRFQGPDPRHDDVAECLARAPSSASAVCVSHGGPAGLGPDREQVWADASDLGRLFRDRRVYAYACDSAGSIESLGARAVEEGVAVFVGHEGPITAPMSAAAMQMVDSVASAAIVGFIDGDDDERSLRTLIFDASDALIPDDIPIDRAAIKNGRPNFWTQSEVFDKLAFSLRVHRREGKPR
ncbi:MAG: hypothetical protein AB1Z98_27735 [Nannocystaceae bacterium]